MTPTERNNDWRRALIDADSFEAVIAALREAVALGWSIYAEELEFTEDAQRSGFTLEQCRFLWSWLKRFKRDAVDEARD